MAVFIFNQYLQYYLEYQQVFHKFRMFNVLFNEHLPKKCRNEGLFKIISGDGDYAHIKSLFCIGKMSIVRSFRRFQKKKGKIVENIQKSILKFKKLNSFLN